MPFLARFTERFMPKGKRNLMVADALRDEGEEEFDEANEPDEDDEIPPAPVAPVMEAVPPAVEAPPPSAPITMSLGDLQSILAQVQAGNTALADAVTQGIASSRKPIPENDLHHGVSALNPLGEQTHPRPGLRCKVTFGVMDPKTQQVTQTYPLESDDLTVWEQLALNTLTPVHAQVHLLDGTPIKVSVHPEIDKVTDAITKLTIVVPTYVTAKGSQVKNMLPGAVNLVQQLTGKDWSKVQGDDLKWFMAEHRAGRYVSEREGVAA